MKKYEPQGRVGLTQEDLDEIIRMENEFYHRDVPEETRTEDPDETEETEAETPEDGEEGGISPQERTVSITMTYDDLLSLSEIVSTSTMLLQKDVLTSEEAAIYMGLSKSYLYKLTMNRAIPHYKPTGKMCYFKRTELDEWLTSNPVPTKERLDAQAMSYCMRNKILSKKPRTRTTRL